VEEDVVVWIKRGVLSLWIGHMSARIEREGLGLAYCTLIRRLTNRFKRTAGEWVWRGRPAMLTSSGEWRCAAEGASFQGRGSGENSELGVDDG
jgi:hypothetical protein